MPALSLGGSHARVTRFCADRPVLAPDTGQRSRRAKLSVVRAVHRPRRRAKLRLRDPGAVYGDGERRRRLLRAQLHVSCGRRPSGAPQSPPPLLTARGRALASRVGKKIVADLTANLLRRTAYAGASTTTRRPSISTPTNLGCC